MNNRKKTIASMQEALNRFFVSDTVDCKKGAVYELSVQLDKEIVKYYRSQLLGKC